VQFRNSSLLEEVSLDHNKLTLGDAGAFDYCPKLRVLDVSHNSISAAVFHFAGTTNIEKIDFSHNSIRGGIPVQWAQLQSCTAVRASHNLIEQPLKAIKSLSKIETMDFSHNRIKWEEVMIGESSYQVWMFNVLPGNAAKFDLSHNLMRQPYGTLGEPWVGGSRTPQLIDLDLSNNFLWGYVRLGAVHYNFDLRNNNMTLLDVISADDCCTTRGIGAQLSSIDIRHQISPIKFSQEELPFESIDHALNSSSKFKTIELIPRHDSFEQVEHPTGTGRHPFVCPAWRGRSESKMNFYMDPEVYGYTGGSTAELRSRWFDELDADYEEYQKEFLQDQGFCRCILPFVGVPPDCLYTCGPARYRSTSGGCEDETCCFDCPPGTVCNLQDNALESMKIAPGHWRVANTSLGVRPCVNNPEACEGGDVTGKLGIQYCKQDHRGPYCSLCVSRTTTPTATRAGAATT
jgi:hypothetical protein